MKWLSLDPSVNTVGYATFDDIEREWTWGMWTLEGNNYLMRLQDLRDRIQEDVGEFQMLVAEWPTFYGGARGAIAAHKNYTIDLAGICAYVMGWFHIDFRKTIFTTAPQWKGQVPKLVTERKFYRTLGKDASRISEHAIDATMLLRFELIRRGVLKQTTEL